MAINPFDRKPERTRPRIWAEGGQRPPFDMRALGRASLFFARQGVAPLHAWIARTGRRAALNVRDGAGRIPEARLGRVAPFVPSHQRVAMWIKNYAAIHAHASASADTDVARGNALVAAVDVHLWPLDATGAAEMAATAPALATPSATPPEPDPEPISEPAPEPAPVVLSEPLVEPDDPLASIRADIAGKAANNRAAAPRPSATRIRAVAATPEGPPAPPGQVATTAIQIAGWLIGWGTAIIALPYGLARALVGYARGQDLRRIGIED